MRCKIGLVIFALTPFAASAQSIERPSPKVGDECHYDVLDNLNAKEKIAERHAVVTGVDADQITMKWTQTILVARDTEDLEAGTWIYDRDLNVIQINSRKFDSPYPARFYPLSPGAEIKNVTSKYPRATNDGNGTTSLDGKVGTWEKLAVPAGTFDVLRINWTGNYYATTPPPRGSFSGSVEQEISLSPTTWCQVSGSVKTGRPRGGGIWNHRTNILTSFKN